MKLIFLVVLYLFIIAPLNIDIFFIRQVSESELLAMYDFEFSFVCFVYLCQFFLHIYS